MKRTALIIGGIALLLNIVLGLLISKYSLFNACLNSVVIIVTTILIFVLNKIEIRDAFRFSLTFFFAFIGFVCFIFGFFSKGTFTDNWPIIADVILLAFEVILLLVTSFVSKSVKR